MHIRNLTLVLAGLVAASPAAQAQEAAKTFVYATYFYCEVGGQARADEIFKAGTAPVLDQMHKEGKITAWGWLAHHTGGKWRRVQHYQAPGVAALLDAQEDMNQRLDGVNPEADAEFDRICRAHEDYIWERKAGMSGVARGEAAFSVYYVCNEAREERADEIFAKDFGPILDKSVADGELISWGWFAHQVGGEYRRLQTMTAADHKTLLKARDELIAEMYRDEFKPGEEFTDICGSHADYMWNVQAETP